MILREYEENGFKITEFTSDGTSVSSQVEEKIWTEEEINRPVKVSSSDDEIQAQTLVNTEYLVIMSELANL